jgi:5-methyltetrahydrofolate--homocysteine methyltransferase
MHLTERLAMTPAASISGFHLAHPGASYFNVGRIGEDQLKAWAVEVGVDEEPTRRRLSASLSSWSASA